MRKTAAALGVSVWYVINKLIEPHGPIEVVNIGSRTLCVWESVEAYIEALRARPRQDVTKNPEAFRAGARRRYEALRAAKAEREATATAPAALE
jgi:hypothetical protein